VGTVRRSPRITNVLNSDRRLTLQLFYEMGNFFLVVVIGVSGAL
jgi:hypothetical protein